MQGLARLQAKACGGRQHLCLPQQRRRLGDRQKVAVPQQQQHPRCSASFQSSLASSIPLSSSRKGAVVIARSATVAGASSSFNEKPNDDGLPPAITQALKIAAVAGAAAAFAAWRAGYGPVILVSQKFLLR